MYSTIISGGVRGIYSYLIQVEVDISQGLPSFDMVGLLGSEVKEARERVKVSLKNVGIIIPPMKITVNLSPANIRKEGTAYDLPVAVGILRSLGKVEEGSTEGVLLIGELGLNGEIRPVKGVLPVVQEAAKHQFKCCIVPKENEMEGGIIQGIDVYGMSNLKEVIEFLKNYKKPLVKPVTIEIHKLLQKKEEPIEDFAEMYGQEVLRRASMIAAAGFHHLLMIGPPGSGKTMAAKRIAGILPPMSMSESLEVSAIYSVAGKLDAENGLITKRPFLNPHHTITEQALTGGGAVPHPGVLSLSHRGILFLDELPEFKRSTLDLLRQPIEDKKIHIARRAGTFSYPADILMICAMNPCKCGYYPDFNKCTCTQSEVRRYLGHVSGPIIDRIDLIVEAPKIELSAIQGCKMGESSYSIQKIIKRAREMQEKRFAGTSLRFNADMKNSDIIKYCQIRKKEEQFMSQIFESLNLSARGYQRILKVARTIADLEQSDSIELKHLTEAVCYRRGDEKYWHK